MGSKIEGTSLRLTELRKLVWDLPEIYLETLKYFTNHLCEVAAHSYENKMEVRNLATVLGPTLMRTADDNMMSMVTDMAHQCQIIESILSNWEFFFTVDLSPESVLLTNLNNIKTAEGPMSVLESDNDNKTLMLANLHKLEYAGKVKSPKG